MEVVEKLSESMNLFTSESSGKNNLDKFFIYDPHKIYVTTDEKVIKLLGIEHKLCKKRGKNRSSSSSSSNPWEEQFVEFEAHARMPRESVIFNWENTQLSRGPFGLDYEIKKENELNEGGNWSDRKVRLENWIVQKNCGMHNDKWEEQYAEIEAHVGMPAENTELYHWKKNQLRYGRAGLDYDIEKEIEANEGGSVWST